ncbi:AAA family ATPase [Patescibacteria group bacterium]|nr:AAA family ATPase [Patescibacteria group bacterium]MBU1029180.1 AAA family ATPase [Patescibacteria group bacterium]
MPRIVLLGEPGSGKSTLAKEISRHIRAVLIESSTAVIYPIAALSYLPNEKTLLNKLGRLSTHKPTSVSRERAVEIYRLVSETYSSDFIARALHHRYLEQSAKRTIIFSGLRGYDNATYCRLHNDFLIYLTADTATLIKRLVENRAYNKKQAAAELKNEQALYRTRAIKKIANLVIDTTKYDILEIAQKIIQAIQREYQMCQHCVNTARNPAIKIGNDGYCQICSAYLKYFDPKHLKDELRFLHSFKNRAEQKYDVMVGISGGKDSTATLATIKKMGFRPLAFTFNLGYLPKTTIPRARMIAKRLGVDFELIDIRPYIRRIDRESYKKMAALYELPFTLQTKEKFIAAYTEGRQHYSVRCKHSPTFVRSCQLCRRMVIRAYYAEAIKRDIPAIVLGINEWTNLSAAQRGGAYRVSGVRTLRPTPQASPVHVFHLPFLLQMTSTDTKRILHSVGWTAPKGEDFIESNSNSCLFARSTERDAKRLLGFHPDSTRLSREVTVGFITKRQALKALKKIHPYKYTPRQVLERMGILK